MNKQMESCNLSVLEILFNYNKNKGEQQMEKKNEKTSFKYERPDTIAGFLADFWWVVFPFGGFLTWMIKEIIGK